MGWDGCAAISLSFHRKQKANQQCHLLPSPLKAGLDQPIPTDCHVSPIDPSVQLLFIHSVLCPVAQTPENFSTVFTNYISMMSIVDANKVFLFADPVNGTGGVTVISLVYFLPHYRD
ncbi:unnamed protein product [Cercopithifilaria johnstoni]|uniref:Uncharacterized protein n=1 Tax=Cercopithifilaria johnstoni TaxID=2874296 RepID=A0A8J2M5R7_9BILA|nr:unnamed protein product [Cercopithifilaria johnstoni]